MDYQTILQPRAFSLRQLQYAVAVADTLSFRKASERCHVAQPSLSAQIAKLEQDLGIQLFERDRQHVLITPAGQAILERARALLRDAADLETEASRATGLLRGKVRFGVIPTISPYLLPQLTPALRSAYPELQTYWIEEKTSVLIDRLRHAELDAALLALESQHVEDALGSLEYSTIAKDPFVLATPRAHKKIHDLSLLTLKELRGTEILLLEEGHCLNEQIGGLCSRVKAKQAEFRATSLPTLVQMVAGGAGITLLPELAIPTETRRARVSLRRFARPAPYRTIIFLWRKQSALGRRLQRSCRSVPRTIPDRAVDEQPTPA